MGYVRIRSWHAILTYTRSGGIKTLCGRFVAPPINELWLNPELPGDEKSCESCLRSLARVRDREDQADAQGSGLD